MILGWGVALVTIGLFGGWYAGRLRRSPVGRDSGLDPARERWVRALSQAPDPAALELLGREEPHFLAPVRFRIQDLLRRLERAQRKALEGETVRSEALATLAHELKTPLTAIRGYSKLILEGEAGPVTAQQSEYLNVIQESVTRVVKIADEVLEGARDPGMADRSKREPFLVSDLWRELEQTTRVLAPSHLKLSFEVRELPANVRIVGDRLHLLQALLNLVTNALKYTEHGGVAVTARVEGLGSIRPLLAISVRDTGIGIPLEEQSHIFERFYRAARAREMGLPGLGLGLSMTRQWIEEVDGRISLWSAPGEGSEFKVELPCEVH